MVFNCSSTIFWNGKTFKLKNPWRNEIFAWWSMIMFLINWSPYREKFISRNRSVSSCVVARLFGEQRCQNRYQTIQLSIVIGIPLEFEWIFDESVRNGIEKHQEFITFFAFFLLFFQIDGLSHDIVKKNQNLLVISMHAWHSPVEFAHIFTRNGFVQKHFHEAIGNSWTKCIWQQDFTVFVEFLQEKKLDFNFQNS